MQSFLPGRCTRRTVAIALVLGLQLTASPLRAARDPQGAPAPHRIISLVPAVTEMIFAIGAGADVVGVSSFDTFPPEVASRPKVGALVDPDFERILTLRPDLVVVYGTQSDLIARLDRARIPMFRYQHAGLPDVMTTIRQLGDRIGHRREAEALAARIEADLAGVQARIAGRGRPRTALLFGRDPGTLRDIYASAGEGFLHDVLVAAGGTDVFADVAHESLQASTEVLLARAPEVVVELHEGGWSPDRLSRERAVWSGLPSLPAVRNSRVYLLSDDRLMIPGPRIGEAVRLIADVLHP